MVVNQNAAKFPYKYGLADDDSGVTIPYAMSDPVALDVWNQEEDVVGDDGYIDRVYVGDMTGNVYGIKFNLDPYILDSSTSTTTVSNSDFGIYVDLWPTKPILSADLYTNKYRADRQPITVSLATTFDESSSDHLRVIIGTGKYDDVYLGDDDKADTARMSLYNLKDPIALPSLNSGYEIYDSSHRTGFKVAFEAHCTDKTFRTGCTWAKVTTSTSATTKVTVCSNPSDLSTCQQVAGSTSPDCCEGSTSDTCSSPCYECVYDFTLPSTSTYPGERVVGKPLIAGGLIFLTTFVPPHDPCGYTGEGYLYAFSADCVPIIDPNSVFSGSGTAVGAVTSGTNTASGGIRYSLGSGIPSKAVLDSRGENLIIQMSDGTLKRVGVNLPTNPVSVKGWRVR
jgi:type IV pilus assembly protein PilY1